MKLTVMLLLLSVGSVSFAEEGQDSSFAQAEKRLKDYCAEGHGSQPGWPDMLASIDILADSAKTSACTLYKKMGLTEKHNLYMKGFRSLPKGNEFTYELIDFTDSSNPVDQLCVATSHYEPVPGGMWDETQEVFDIACQPHKD